MYQIIREKSRKDVMGSKNLHVMWVKRTHYIVARSEVKKFLHLLWQMQEFKFVSERDARTDAGRRCQEEGWVMSMPRWRISALIAPVA